MIRGPRTTALLAAFAALALAAGCAGAPARPAGALAVETGGPRAPAPPAPIAEAPASEGAVLVAAPAPQAATPDAVALPAVAPAPRTRPARRLAPNGGAPTPDTGRAVLTGEEVPGVRGRVLEAARRMLGKRPRLDCSGFVLAALAEAGVSVDLRPARSRSESLFRASRLVTRPSPGDLVFFHRTHDRDRRGRRAERNRFTHVALVEAVDGTALTLLHRGGKRVERIRMDLSRPSDPAANDPVRLRRARDRAGTRYLSGELFAAFGGLLPDDVTRKLQARRGRDTPARHPASR